MSEIPAADGASSSPSPAPAPAPEPAGGPSPVPIPPGVDPPASAVDLHVKLGPLQDRGVSRPRAGQIWAWALVGGGLAGFAAWLAGESVLGWFVAEGRTAAEAAAMAIPAAGASPDAVARAASRNAALAIGLLGWLMAFLLGIAGGMVRSSLRAGLRAALVGSGLGLAVGAGVTMLVLPIYSRALSHPENAGRGLLLAIAALGVVWGSVGATAGASFGGGMGGVKRVALGLFGGFLGGLAGAAVYVLVGSMAFPMGDAGLPVSDSREARLLARALAALCTSAGVAAFVAPTRFQPPQERETAV